MAEASMGMDSRSGGWAVKHNGGFLGYARTRSEALQVAQELRSWLNEQGRPAEIQVEAQRGPTGASYQ